MKAMICDICGKTIVGVDTLNRLDIYDFDVCDDCYSKIKNDYIIEELNKHIAEIKGENNEQRK